MPTIEETRVFFDAIARRYDRVYAPSPEQTRARMARVVKALGAPKRVLDLGVGTGRELPALLDAGHVVTGVDCSDEMIALCNQRARTIPIVRADLWRALPFDDASFDAVVSLFGSLSHPPNAASITRLGQELASVLVPDGVLYFEVPTPAWVAAGGARHDDGVAGVGIDVVAVDAEEWTRALPNFTLTIETVDDELIVIGTRNSKHK